MVCAHCKRELDGAQGRYCGACAEYPPGSGFYVPVREMTRESMRFKFINVAQTSDFVPRWEVRNNKSGALLGWIRLYPLWKQYVFLPCEGTVWSVDCLAAVEQAIGIITQG
jgi:hypothetical protein